jgi:hypothetical protein
LPGTYPRKYAPAPLAELEQQQHASSNSIGNIEELLDAILLYSYKIK